MWKLILISVLTFQLAFAAVVYDNQTSVDYATGTTVTTSAFTITASVNRAAMIHIGFNSTAPTSITASVGGVSGSLVSGTDTTTTATGWRSLIFCVIAPPSGSQTATVSWTTSVDYVVGVLTASGVDQTTPCVNGTFAAGVAGGTTSTVTITSNSGDLTSSIAQTNGAWVASPPSNQTLTWGLRGGTTGGGDRGPGTAGPITHTWTDQFGGQTYTVSGANFKASGGAAAKRRAAIMD